jgi:hypothetical protein
MNRVSLVLTTLLALMGSAGAHPFAPPTLDYVAKSDVVYLVRAGSSVPGPDSVHPAKVVFSITEVLRGNDHAPLVLSAYEWNPYPKDSEWIIFHNSSGFKDCIGWAMEGDCEWLPIKVTRDGGKESAEWVGPLDGVRQYLHDHPAKP